MSAGTIAYISWAYGLPNSVFAQFSWLLCAPGRIFRPVTSTLLGMLAGLFQQPLKSDREYGTAIMKQRYHPLIHANHHE